MWRARDPRLRRSVSRGRSLDAVDAAHEKGIIHRDLKSANIKIRPDGSVQSPRLRDRQIRHGSCEGHFRCANHVALDHRHDSWCGWLYVASRARQRVDKRADIWTFGVVLFEMTTGKRLFEEHRLRIAWRQF